MKLVKLKLIMLDTDKNYLNRLVTAVSLKPDFNAEVYSFTDQSAAVEAAKENGADFFLAGDCFEIDAKLLPEGCPLAYLTDSAEKAEVRGHKAICRYQKAELIFREILSVCSDRCINSARSADGAQQPADTKIYSFFSCGGGTGGSSAAAACSLRFANAGLRVLYLNLERFGSAESYFSAEGRIHLGDVLYAVKSKKANLALKLQSAVKRDDSGVFFIDSCRVAPEVMEITPDSLADFLAELKASSHFDCILIDMDLLLEGVSLTAMRQSTGCILVSDGAETSLLKLSRICKAMEIVSARDELTFPPVYLMYNQFSSRTGRSADELELPLLGGAPKFEGLSVSRVIRKLAELPLFDRLL